MLVTAATSDLFEMRRLESLSNTIFGVAMTLLAYDLPKTVQFAGPPDWADLYHLYAGRLAALILSFIIAGVFWISHHRRLMRQPECGRGTGGRQGMTLRLWRFKPAPPAWSPGFPCPEDRA
jgi:hypothetical protein